MPVTARLSQKFYEQFGEDVTNELVDWFNAVDATYRTDLRELNELNFARFDAKLEQRFAESDAKWERRFAELDAKLEQGLADVDVKLAGLKGEMIAEMGRLRGETTAAIATAQSTTVKWMFGFWAPTAVGIVATGIGVITLLLRH